MQCNTAIFYDIENLICLYTVKNNTILQLDEIYRRILELEEVNGVSAQKAYADWAVQINRNLRQFVLQIGIEPVQIFNTNQNDRVKNAADVSLIIDAVELLAKRPEIENYVIVSGDGIFAFLAKKLHEYGKRVIGCGFDRNTNIIFRNACDQFINLDRADKKLTIAAQKNSVTPQPEPAADSKSPAADTQTGTPPVKPVSAPPLQPQAKTAQTAQPKIAQPVQPAQPPAKAPPAQQVSAPAKPAQPAVSKKIPKKFPKNKFSELIANVGLPIWKNPLDANGTLLAIRDVINGLFSAEPEEDNPDLEISVLKIYIDYYVPGFKMSLHRFKRFGEFIRFVICGSPYCLYTSSAENTTIKIARRDVLGSKGLIMSDSHKLQVNLMDGSVTDSVFNVPEHENYTYEAADLTKTVAAPDVKNAETQTAETETREAQTAGETVQAPERKAALAAELAVKPPADDSPAALEKSAETEYSLADAAEDGGSEEGSVRKWIKSRFLLLSDENLLTPDEVTRLLTAEYSQQAFGIKTPILKEVVYNGNLREQRLAGGKIKYWKEMFTYNDKNYLVYKEWIASMHRQRFALWLKKQEPDAAQG